MSVDSVLSEREFVDAMTERLRNNEICYTGCISHIKELTDFKNLLNTMKQCFDICKLLKKRTSLNDICRVADLCSEKLSKEVTIESFKDSGYMP